MAAKTVKPKPAYPTDVGDEEWQFCRPYLELMTEDAPQREHSLRDVFNAVRYVARAGCPWRMLPHDLPPWPLFTSNGSAGSRRDAWRPGLMICAFATLMLNSLFGKSS